MDQRQAYVLVSIGPSLSDRCLYLDGWTVSIIAGVMLLLMTIWFTLQKDG